MSGGIEIDEQISTTNQVEACKRGVFENVVFRKDDLLSDALNNLIGFSDGQKIFFKKVSGYSGDAGSWIKTAASEG